MSFVWLCGRARGSRDVSRVQCCRQLGMHTNHRHGADLQPPPNKATITPNLCDVGAVLGRQWDTFRQYLVNLLTTESRDMREWVTPFQWLVDITAHARRKDGPMTFKMERALYLTFASLVLACGNAPVLQRGNTTNCTTYGTAVAGAFTAIAAANMAGTRARMEGESWCNGQAGVFDIVLNIPVVLVIHFNIPEPLAGESSYKIWDIIKSLYPFPKDSAASACGVRYSIASHVYSSSAASHFIVRYCSSQGGKTRIFDYNGRKHEGHAILQSATTVKGVLIGPSDLLKDIP
ncbi:hypothetical protein K438DRAFT_1773382 [Mycena galopus ATCC 62051]|nr:hypothetical protein K438DRAFT_1773382 [Mycena galopus ATCC 62051]